MGCPLAWVLVCSNSNSVKSFYGYPKFSNIPKKTIICIVQYEKVPDSESPLPDEETCWWNVMQISANVNASRILQVAHNAFSKRNIIYFRIKHDTTWHGWYALTGESIGNLK